MPVKSKLDELWLVQKFGADLAYIIFYSLFGAGVIVLSVTVFDWRPFHFWIPAGVAFGALMGILYGYDRALRNPETLTFYIGASALFPKVVLKHFLQHNGAKNLTGKKFEVLAYRWNAQKTDPGPVLISVGNSYANIMVPENVLVTYMQHHFPVSVMVLGEHQKFTFHEKSKKGK